MENGKKVDMAFLNRVIDSAGLSGARKIADKKLGSIADVEICITSSSAIEFVNQSVESSSDSKELSGSGDEAKTVIQKK